MVKFEPNYKNVLNAANNVRAERIPLYEHNIDAFMMEKLTGTKFVNFVYDKETVGEFFKHYCSFFKEFGYDTVTYEACITEILPGGGALGGHVDPVIKTREDFEKYPFDKVLDVYKAHFDYKLKALKENMPENMKAIGGVGNGVFEIAQDLVGYENLCLLAYDDEQLYADLFVKIGDMMLQIWKYFLDNFSDMYCVCRFGDDLGYKLNTMLPHEDIRKHVIPQYKRVISFIKSYNKPFLLHSCGCIFPVMEDIIAVGINAKHSNEEVIANFGEWVKLYGDRIGNFGGIDTDLLVRGTDEEIVNMVNYVYDLAINKKGGIAIGSGNSIPGYVDPRRYKLMLDTVRKLRGDIC